MCLMCSMFRASLNTNRFQFWLQWMHPIRHHEHTQNARSRAQMTAAKNKCHFIPNISIYFYAFRILAQTRSCNGNNNNNSTSSSGHHTSHAHTRRGELKSIELYFIILQYENVCKSSVNWYVFFFFCFFASCRRALFAFCAPVAKSSMAWRMNE